MKAFIFLLALIFLQITLFAQCTVYGYSTTDTVICGHCATLSAFGEGQGQTVFNENFNNGQPTGWAFTQQAMWNNPCSVNGIDGTTHLWMGNQSGVPRTLQTTAFNLSTATSGVSVCFDLLFAMQGDDSPCEGPDEPDEGVNFQYSTNGGTSWITINYFDPNGGEDPLLINWHHWCYNLPASAITSGTIFRWFQDNDSGEDFDHWGIDNVEIFYNDPTFVITYLHDNCNLGMIGGIDPTPVCPLVSTQYIVQMTNGTNFCYDTVKVNVKMPVIEMSAGTDTSLCPNQCVQLNGEGRIIDYPARTITYENNQTTLVDDGSVDMNINVTGLNMPQILPNSIAQVCISGFTFTGGQPCTNFIGCWCNGATIGPGQVCNINLSSFNVILHSPNGCDITLVPTSEATGNNYSDVCFVPAGGQSISSSSFPHAGNWNPYQSLSLLNGCASNGLWNLEISVPGGLTGLTSSSGGSLTGWSMTFNDIEVSSSCVFEWSPTTNMTNNTTLTPTVCPNANTTYTLTVSDSAHCVSATDTVTVSIHNCCNFTYSNNIIHPSCGLNNGSINITVITPGLYSYVWDTGDTTSNVTTLAAGAYSVTITDIINGCSNYSTYTLINPGAPSLTFNVVNSTCNNANGSAMATATGGVPPYTYHWSNGCPNQNAMSLIAGDYIVSVSDSNSCEVIGDTTIVSPAQPTTIMSTTNAICEHPNGAADLTITGGVLPYTVHWSNNAITEDISGLAAGDYFVTITDANSCSVIDTARVIQDGLVSIALVSKTDILCKGGNNGSVKIIATGGAPPYTYHWQANSNWNQSTITGLFAGVSSVTVTDSNGCFSFINFTITEPDKLGISSLQDKSICPGTSVTLAVSGTGGTPPYMYHWSNNHTGEFIAISPSNNTTYSCYITDANACISNTVISEISILPSLSAEAHLYIDSICSGDSTQIFVSISQGNPPYLFILQDESIVSSPFWVSPDQTEQVSVFVKDNCNLIDSTSVLVNILPKPSAIITSDKYVGCTPLTVHFVEPSLNAGQSYLWCFGNPDENNLSLSKNPIHVFDIPGKYDISLLVTSCYGCKTYSSITDMITVYPLPESRFIYSPILPNIINPLVSFTNLSTGNEYNFWSFGDGDSSIKINPDHAYQHVGDYNVSLITKTDKGCKDTLIISLHIEDYYTLYAPTAFSPDHDGRNDIFYIYGSGILENDFMFNIYNRWGEIIFTSNDLHSGWDGTINGEMAQIDSYVWIAIFKDFQGNGKTATGKFTLIR